METILIPTDFSTASDHAAAFGFKLAEKLRLNIQLCHANKDTSTDASSAAKLVTLAGSLAKGQSPSRGNFIPLIKFTSMSGTVTSVAQTMAESASISLVVMGTSGTGGQHKGFTGSDSHDMIEASRIPLLLVPPLASKELPRKIAFATDLDEKDMPILHSLATLARDLNAEIIIVHIDAGSYDHETRKGQLHRFLDKVLEDIRFTAFSCRNIEGKNVAEGLNRIANEGSVNMLVMSHSRHRQLESLLNAGNGFTLEMAKDLRIPLLVFPKDRVASAHPVF